MRGIGLLLVGLAMAGCTQAQESGLVTKDHVFRDPKTGQTFTCSGGWQYGGLGMMQQQDQGACDDRMWSQGYERLPPGTKPDTVAAPKS